MKKMRLFRNAIALVLALVMLAGFAAAEEEEFLWSGGGKYLPSALQGIRTIGNEQEAEAYAEELWKVFRDDEVVAGTREMSVDHSDESYHFGIFDDKGACVYSANFLSNGLVQAVTFYDYDARWYTDGQFTEPDPDRLDKEAWAKVQAWITERAEKLDPGVLELVEPMAAWRIRDVGDRQYISISAEPKEEGYEAGLNVTVILAEDGGISLVDYSLYGLG